MKDVLILVGLFAGLLILNKWVLPKLGFHS